MSARTVVAVSAGMSQPSSTRLLADRLVAATVDALATSGIEATVEVVELRELAHDVMDMMLTGFPSARLSAAIDAVTQADGVVAVSPVFTASFSGLFKSFLDVLDSTSLVGKPVLLGATAGTPRHSLVLEHAMRPVFAYLRTDTVATGVFAATEDWGAPGTASTELTDRVARAGTELAAKIDAYAGPAPAGLTLHLPGLTEPEQVGIPRF